MFRMIRPLMSSTPTITHNPALHRFIASYPDLPGQSYIEYRFVTPTVVDFFRTVTEPELRGKGAAGEVVKQAFIWAEENKFRIKPSCSYVSHFVEQNKQWATLLVSKLYFCSLNS
jgi:predicted GNAT family acetyltransferase